MGINPDIFGITKTDGLPFRIFIDRHYLVMWTPKAFHLREIPANNIIHVTDSLAVHQTRQNIWRAISSKST